MGNIGTPIRIGKTLSLPFTQPQIAYEVKLTTQLEILGLS